MTKESIDLAAIRARAEAATPGPWEASNHGRIDGGGYAEVITPGPVRCMAYCYGGSSTVEGDNLPADAEHIAGMDPSTTLALVAEVERLRKRELVCADFDALHDHLLRLNEEGISPDVSGYDRNGSPILAWLDEEGGDATHPLALTLGGEDAAHPEPDRHDAARLAYPVLILDTSVLGATS